MWHLSAVARRLVLLIALLGGWANGGNSTCASCCAEISLMSMKGKDEKLKRLVQLEGVYRRVPHQVVNDRCVFKTSGGKRTLFFRAEHWIVAQRAFAESIRGATFMRVEGAGHNVHVDRPIAVAEAIRTVIGRAQSACASGQLGFPCPPSS